MHDGLQDWTAGQLSIARKCGHTWGDKDWFIALRQKRCWSFTSMFAITSLGNSFVKAAPGA